MTNEDTREKLYQLLANSVVNLTTSEIREMYEHLRNFDAPCSGLVISKNNLKFPEDFPAQLSIDISRYIGLYVYFYSKENVWEKL